MGVIESIVLGIVQGLTEFLPVSSSGHLAIGSALFGIDGEANMTLTMVLHFATVLSTITIFWGEIIRVFRGVFKFKLNQESIFAINIIISMLPIGLVGIFFQEQIEVLFEPNLLLVGAMLLVTAGLLTLSQYCRPKIEKPITPKRAFIIGIAQAVAAIPGISRSGATISTGLLLGVKRTEVSKFSFLMVLIPIIGMNFLELRDGIPADTGISGWALLAGGLSAYIVGALACKAMIKLVNKGGLVWFAAYCAVVGIISIACGV